MLGYTGIVYTFGALYAAMWRIDSHAFAFGWTSHYDLGFFDFLYFSLVTATTLGYGDIVPVTPAARVVVCIEVLLGIGWITVVFAAVVARLRTPR